METQSYNSKSASDAAYDLKNKIQTAGSRLETLSQDVGERLGELSSTFMGTASEYVSAGRKYVRENPAKGVAIAAAAGLVAGGLITLAMRRK